VRFFLFIPIIVTPKSVSETETSRKLSEDKINTAVKVN
jgi:hypothetical protein